MFAAYTPVTGARVLFSLLALELGANAFEVGLIAAGIQVPMLLFSVPVALLMDRLGGRWLLLAGSVFGVLAVLLAYFYPVLPAIIAASVLFGLWGVLTFQPTQAMTGLFSAPGEHARNFSLYQFFAAMTLLVGPFLAGISIDAFGHAGALLVLLPFPLASIATLLFSGAILESPHAARARGPGLRETLADSRVWRLIAISSISSVGFELYPFFLPLYGHAAGLSASSIGSIVSLAAVGGLALPFVLAQLVQRVGEERVLAGCLVLTAAGFVIVPFTVNVALLVLSALLFGFGVAATIPVTSMLAYSRLPAVRAGQFLGLRNAGNAGARGVAPPIFGALAALVGLPAVFVVVAVMMGLAGAWVGRAATDSKQI